MDRSKSEIFNSYLNMAIREGWADPVGFANRRMDELEKTERARMQHHEFMGGDATCDDDVA